LEANKFSNELETTQLDLEDREYRKKLSGKEFLLGLDYYYVPQSSMENENYNVDSRT
jgi:hypothetical protein